MQQIDSKKILSKVALCFFVLSCFSCGKDGSGPGYEKLTPKQRQETLTTIGLAGKNIQAFAGAVDKIQNAGSSIDVTASTLDRLTSQVGFSSSQLSSDDELGLVVSDALEKNIDSCIIETTGDDWDTDDPSSGFDDSATFGLSVTGEGCPVKVGMSFASQIPDEDSFSQNFQTKMWFSISYEINDKTILETGKLKAIMLDGSFGFKMRQSANSAKGSISDSLKGSIQPVSGKTISIKGSGKGSLNASQSGAAVKHYSRTSMNFGTHKAVWEIRLDGNPDTAKPKLLLNGEPLSQKELDQSFSFLDGIDWLDDL